jgi:hypothetical protein
MSCNGPRCTNKDERRVLTKKVSTVSQHRDETRGNSCLGSSADTGKMRDGDYFSSVPAGDLLADSCENFSGSTVSTDLPPSLALCSMRLPIFATCSWITFGSGVGVGFAASPHPIETKHPIVAQQIKWFDFIAFSKKTFVWSNCEIRQKNGDPNGVPASHPSPKKNGPPPFRRPLLLFDPSGNWHNPIRLGLFLSSIEKALLRLC